MTGGKGRAVLLQATGNSTGEIAVLIAGGKIIDRPKLLDWRP
ncbi:MAG TPA: hypothetical protein VE567_02825 [Sphingomonas sp.]|nr:hypothetical protein [Sphingomonas sp.]